MRILDYEQAARQLAALRAAARYRNPHTGRRHFAHLNEYRAAFVLGIIELRKFKRSTKEWADGYTHRYVRIPGLL